MYNSCASSCIHQCRTHTSILMLAIHINLMHIHIQSQCRTHTFTRIARIHHQCRTHTCPRICAFQHRQCRTHTSKNMHIPNLVNAGLIRVQEHTHFKHRQCRTHSCPRTRAFQTSSMQDSFVSKNMRNSNIINAGLIRVQEHVHLYTFTMHNSFMILHKYDMDASWSPTGYHIIERPYTCITHGLHSHSHAHMCFMKDEIVVSFTQPVLKTFSFIEIMGLLTF
jgi:hypothetical protein